MIGNISFATNPNELTFILQTRMNTKVAAYKSRGIDAPKCKVISIDDFCPRGIEDFYVRLYYYHHLELWII